jgi:hypothetical protein
MAMASTLDRLSTEPTNQDGREGTPALASEAAAPSSPTKDDPPPLRSVHTSNFSAILQELGVSILVTTYQAGKLVMLRPDGERLNTHFRSFSKPMGLAVDGDRLAIGTSVEIWEYHNAPAVARRLEPAGSHDACFLPRSSVCTGDIQIHEMAWAPVADHSPLTTHQTPSCGSSTRASPACARGATRTASCRAGGRRLSRRWRRRIAVT